MTVAAAADHLRVRRPPPQDAPGIARVADDIAGTSMAHPVGMAVVVQQTRFNGPFKIGHWLLLRLPRGQITPPGPALASPADLADRPAPIIATARQDGQTAFATP